MLNNVIRDVMVKTVPSNAHISPENAPKNVTTGTVLYFATQKVVIRYVMVKTVR